MYVCICKGVTDGQIRTEAGAGACTLRELRARLGVAAQCGRCAFQVRQVLQEALHADRPAADDQAAA